MLNAAVHKCWHTICVCVDVRLLRVNRAVDRWNRRGEGRTRARVWLDRPSFCALGPEGQPQACPEKTADELQIAKLRRGIGKRRGGPGER